MDAPGVEYEFDDPDSEYPMLEQATYDDQTGKWTFTMPAADVTVYAQFDTVKYSVDLVTTPDSEAVFVYDEEWWGHPITEAGWGHTVLVLFDKNIDEISEVESAYYVVEGSDEQIPLTETEDEGVYSFEMPKANVTVYVKLRTPSCPVTVDFGEGHDDYVEEQFGNDPDYEIDGSKVKFTMPLGSTVADAIEKINPSGTTLPKKEVNGERFMGEIAKKPLYEYRDEMALSEEKLGYNDIVITEDGITLYGLWEKQAEIKITINDSLECGTELTKNTYHSVGVLNPRPNLTVAGDASAKNESIFFTNWDIAEASNMSTGDTMTLTEDSYDAYCFLVVPWGYYLCDEISNSVEVVGGEIASFNANNFNQVFISIPVEHGEERTVTADPTCEEDGYVKQICSKCGQETTVEVITATGHDWEAPTYTWSDDNSSVTASRTCKNDASHVETETVDTTSEVTKEAKCEEKGETTYTATFENAAFEEQNKTLEDIDALDHAYGEPSYEWSDDNSSVTASRTCKNDASHAETETVEATSKVAKKATCEEKGDTKYTTKAFTNEAFTEQSKTVEGNIPALNHDWDEWTIAKAPTCEEKGTEERVCSHDASHKETREVNALGHDFGDWEVTKEPTTTEEGEETRSCKNDASHKETRSVDKLEEIKTYSIAVNQASVNLTAEEGYVSGTADEGLKEGGINQTIKATSTGTGEVEFIMVGFKDSSSYENFRVIVGGMEATVYPLEGLAPGTYTATVIIEDFDDRFETIEVPVTFTVTAKQDSEDQKQDDPEQDNPKQEDPKQDDSKQEEIRYANTEGNGTKWTKGSTVTADFTFKRSENDSVTFSHFTGIQVDEKDVDKANYTAESGSVIIKLKPAYLETLSVGEHTITAFFNDGNSASAKFTILAKSTNTNSPTSSGTAKKANVVNTSTTAPETGDNNNMLLWLMILCASMLVLVNVINARRRNTIGRR